MSTDLPALLALRPANAIGMELPGHGQRRLMEHQERAPRRVHLRQPPAYASVCASASASVSSGAVPIPIENVPMTVVGRDGLAATAFLSTSPRPMRAAGPLALVDARSSAAPGSAKHELFVSTGSETRGLGLAEPSSLRQNHFVRLASSPTIASLTCAVTPTSPLPSQQQGLLSQWERSHARQNPPTSRGREPLRPAIKSPATSSPSSHFPSEDEDIMESAVFGDVEATETDTSSSSDAGITVISPRPSRALSCPATPRSVTFSDRLERVRRFDKNETPSSVSAENSDGDDGTLHNWSLDAPGPRGRARSQSLNGNALPAPMLDIRIDTTNFHPPATPDRWPGGVDAHPPVLVESIRLTPATGIVPPGTVDISIRVRNLDYNKTLSLRYSLDRWRSRTDVRCEYLDQVTLGIERWRVRVPCLGQGPAIMSLAMLAETEYVGLEDIPPEVLAESTSPSLLAWNGGGPLPQVGHRRRIELVFAVRYQVKGEEFWDNAGGKDYHVGVSYLEPVALSPPSNVAAEDTPRQRRHSLPEHPNDVVDQTSDSYQERARLNRQRWRRMQRDVFPRRNRQGPTDAHKQADVTLERRDQPDICYTEDAEDEEGPFLPGLRKSRAGEPSGPDSWFGRERYSFQQKHGGEMATSSSVSQSTRLPSWPMPSVDVLGPYLAHMHELGQAVAATKAKNGDERSWSSSSSASSSSTDSPLTGSVTGTAITQSPKQENHPPTPVQLATSIAPLPLVSPRDGSSLGLCWNSRGSRDVAQSVGSKPALVSQMLFTPPAVAVAADLPHGNWAGFH